VVAADQLLAKAKQYVQDGGSAVQPWDDKRYQVPGGGAESPKFMQTMMGTIAMTHMNTFGNMPSQQAILSSVYEGLGLPMDRAGKVETRYFITLLQDPTGAQHAAHAVLQPAGVPEGARAVRRTCHAAPSRSWASWAPG
jgi:3-hydroxyacyl-CoA dehydrogenase/enoyl-CoA hydratase/3-hydroxybutyryl-CoA epimerase